MKIGVVGCGALGSYYGAKLCQIGEEVHFLLRSDYDVVRRVGLQIESPNGNFVAHPHCAKEPDAIGECDLVLIGLKTTANAQLGHLLPPLLGERTAVLTLQNGLGNEETLAALAGPDRVLGGLCFVCLNRIKPGVILHMAHGDILLGEFQRPPAARTQRFADLFQKAGIRCKLADSLERAHWQKLVWNIPFNGLGVASAAGLAAVLAGRVPADAPLGPCWSTDRLLADPSWSSLVRELMGEVVSAARQLGFDLPESIIEDRIERTREMGAYKASTLIDFERGQPLELESLFLEPLRRARSAGVATPRLAGLCQVLSQLDPGRRPQAEL